MTNGRLHLAAAVLIGLAPWAVAAETTAAGGTLIREGVHVLQARGSLHRGEQDGWWVFRIAHAPSDPGDPGNPGNPGNPGAEPVEFTLLPCTLLASLEQLVESMPGQEIAFELTGEVFVYEGRNFLMPTHAPRLVEYVAPSRPNVLGGPRDGDAPPAGSAEAILRDLDRSVGPVLRSPRETGATATTRPHAAPKTLVAPGTLVLWRHGWMVREPDGAWSFVFGADATGLADPPMVLLPCRMLEDLQLHARRSGPGRPLLVSGRVYRYHGRNYLLPTMFRIPRHRTALRP